MQFPKEFDKENRVGRAAGEQQNLASAANASGRGMHHKWLQRLEADMRPPTETDWPFIERI